MNIYIYSDESGVFDHLHNQYYVFAGVIILGDKARDDWHRRYAKVEKDVRNSTHQAGELKAATLSNKYKNKIFRSLNRCHKFAVIVEQWRVNENVWNNRKDKQRYLDYVYKIAVKRALENLINNGVLIPKDVKRIAFYVDEHTTATNGRYELKEGLEQELKNGTYNYNYSLFFPPLFPDMDGVTLDYCNSSTPRNRLIRAADIIANRINYLVRNDKFEEIKAIPDMNCIYQP